MKLTTVHLLIVFKQWKWSYRASNGKRNAARKIGGKKQPHTGLTLMSAWSTYYVLIYTCYVCVYVLYHTLYVTLSPFQITWNLALKWDVTPSLHCRIKTGTIISTQLGLK